MRAYGDTESINLSTGDHGVRVTGDGETRLMTLVESYANAQVRAASERSKDPWTPYGMGCIEKAEAAEKQAKEIRSQIREAVNALSKRT